MSVTRIHKRPSMYGSDRIALVGYHDCGFVIARPAEPHAAKLQERTRALHTKIAGSGTNITDGLRVSVKLLEHVSRGIYRRMWLLSDGHPNREADDIMTAVQEAYDAHVNINCIAFGADADEKLLKRIAGATHNGKFVSVETLRELTDTLIASDTGRRQRHHHRSETTVLCLDLSGSMLGNIRDGMRKIDAVEQSVLRLLSYKQLAFA